MATRPQRPVYRNAPVTLQQPLQSVAAQPQATQQNPILQATYNAPQESNHSPDAAAQQSRSGAELYQPWNLNDFPIRSDESAPYRLVSDSQPTAAKTPPPAGGLQHMLTPKAAPPTPVLSQPAPAKTASVSRASQFMPILGIGRDIMNEFRPSNDRKWSQNHAVLQTAEFNGNQIIIRNVRYSRYESAEKYTTQYYDLTFNLDDVQTIDLVMVPFQGLDRLAHVESSFGLANGQQIGLSIEARYEEGEKYDPLASGLGQFELIYVLADERDMIRLATDVNKNSVHIYRLNFEPHEVQTMFVDALQRANKLSVNPEFYHPITNSCVSNLIDHINKGRPKAIPREHRLGPGWLDSYMYDLKLIAAPAKTFKETKEIAKVNDLVERFGDLGYFSAGIRQKRY